MNSRLDDWRHEPGTGRGQRMPGSGHGMDPQQELRAMERLARLLCKHIEHLVRAAHARQGLDSREGRLQQQVFEERRSQLLQLLASPLRGSEEPRLARLASLIRALEFSRAYFRGT